MPLFLVPFFIFPHLFPIPPRCFPFPPALRSPASYIPLFILGPAPLIPSFSVVGRPASAALASSAWPCQALNGPGMSAVGPGWILLAPINFAGNYASQSNYFTPPDFFSQRVCFLRRMHTADAPFCAPKEPPRLFPKPGDNRDFCSW